MKISPVFRDLHPQEISYNLQKPSKYPQNPHFILGVLYNLVQEQWNVI